MTNILTVMPWRRLIKVALPFWVSSEGKTGVAHLLTIVLLLFGKAAVAVFINHTAGHFSTALEQKNLADFYLYLILSVGSICITVPIDVFGAFFRTRLALIWRQWLSQSLIDKYFGERAGLKIEAAGKLDNVEQRMTQDLDSFCNSLLGLFLAILDATINVCTFITVLWVISPTLSFTVLAYATLGLLIVSQIGKSLVALTSQQVKTEADLRVKLAEAREELVRTDMTASLPSVDEAKSCLELVITTLMNIMVVNKNIQFFTSAFYLVMPLIPAVIMAHSYFAGDIPFGTITQAVMAFTTVFNNATVLIGQFNGLSSLAAVTNRLGALTEGLEGESTSQPSTSPSHRMWWQLFTLANAARHRH